MSRFTSTTTGVTFSVDDSKDDRYEGDGYEPASESGSRKAPAKKAAASKKSE